MDKHIFLIAGEASGDNLGSKLMDSLKEQHQKPLFFSGVGGEKMESHGFSSIFPMHELSLMGFVELLPHIPKLLKRIEQTADAIIALKPDAVVTIDAPAFNHRVIRKVKEKANLDIPFIHYVAPSVWAYKPKRAAKVAALYDHLFCLLPFEPPYFEVEGLSSTFIGHPITETPPVACNSDFLIDAGFIASHPTLAIMPGSRSGELKRLLPIFEKAVKQLSERHDNLQTIVLSTPRFHDRLAEETEHWSAKHLVVSDNMQKNAAINFSTVALAKSGTGSVELSLAGLPTVIAYKVNPISAMMLRRMIQVDFVNLINIILNREIIPECLQQECTPNFIKERLSPLLSSEENRLIQLEQAEEALIKLGKGQKALPSQKAAQVVLSLMK